MTYKGRIRRLEKAMAPVPSDIAYIFYPDEAAMLADLPRGCKVYIGISPDDWDEVPTDKELKTDEQ